jgi:hypothetical protein
MGRRSWIFFSHFGVIGDNAGKHLHNTGHGSKHRNAAFIVLAKAFLGIPF